MFFVLKLVNNLEESEIFLIDAFKSTLKIVSIKSHLEFDEIYLEFVKTYLFFMVPIVFTKAFLFREANGSEVLSCITTKLPSSLLIWSK